MSKFFDWLGKILSRFLIICLILIVCSQIIINDNTTSKRFNLLQKRIENTFRKHIKNNKSTVEVLKDRSHNDKGFIEIEILQDINLSMVYILKNGQKVSNFGKGKVIISVKNGDLIAIDSRKYKKPLWFEIVYKTDNINSHENGFQYRTCGNLIDIGTINFINDKI